MKECISQKPLEEMLNNKNKINESSNRNKKEIQKRGEREREKQRVSGRFKINYLVTNIFGKITLYRQLTTG